MIIEYTRWLHTAAGLPPSLHKMLPLQLRRWPDPATTNFVTKVLQTFLS
jgi:hypothetical protein